MEKIQLELDKNDVIRMLLGLEFLPDYSNNFCNKYGNHSGGMGGPSFKFEAYLLRGLSIQQLIEAYFEIKKSLDK
jgi:hypothetical protein